jgi:hypothetical protein
MSVPPRQPARQSLRRPPPPRENPPTLARFGAVLTPRLSGHTSIIRPAAALTALLLLAAWTGCERPIPPEGPTIATVTEEDLEPLWEAALAVLRKHDFQPDRQDRVMGVIETLPTTSKQWGEFWRQDVADAYDVAEASMHTTQRKATVRIVRGPDGPTVEVQVDVYRLAEPESQITSSSSALQAFSGALPTTEGRVARDDQDRRRWVHLGRDAQMETRLLARILSRTGRFE